MQVNNTVVVDRGNRPNMTQRVGLRTYFINDGAYIDPYEISGVSVFSKSATLSPNSVIGANNNITSVPIMQFGASGATQPVGAVDSSAFDVSNYVPSVTASGVYRIKQGEYVVVFDQTLALSGWDDYNASTVQAATASSVGDYVDMWTVKLAQASDYQVFTNTFTLNEDTFFTFVEPLLLTTSNKLLNKHVRLGEKVDLKVTTETTVQNQDILHSVQNIFKESVITSATMEIRRVNQDLHFDGPFTVSSFSDTAATPTSNPVTITQDNTLILNWDTTTIKDLVSFQNGTFGSLTGTYSVQAKYTLLNELIISPLFYLTVS
tara:strand:+ start:1070 stop:2029 length:960 start_codon:yes stop_codon:yes gene_type:complete